MSLQLYRNEDTGELRAEGRGMFAPDVSVEPGIGRRQLPFYARRPKKSSSVLRYTDDTHFLHCEVQPEEKLSLIGRNVWEELNANGLVYQSYDHAIQQAPAVAYHRVSGPVSVIRLQLSPFLFAGAVNERWTLRFGLSDSLFDDLCIVGREITQHGLLVWDTHSTGLLWDISDGVEVVGKEFQTPARSVLEA